MGVSEMSGRGLIGTNLYPDTQVVEEFWEVGCWWDINTCKFQDVRNKLLLRGSDSRLTRLDSYHHSCLQQRCSISMSRFVQICK